MLCISCILGDKAKQFDLVSLDDGMVMELQALRLQEETLHCEISVLRGAAQHIEEHLEEVGAKLEEKVTQVSGFFKELVKRIEKRHDEVLNRYKTESEVEKARAITYKSGIEHRLGAVEESLELLREISSVRDKFVLLSQTRKVGEALSELRPFRPERFTLQAKEFKPEVELRSVIQDSHDLFSNLQSNIGPTTQTVPGPAAHQLHQRINHSLKQQPAAKPQKDNKLIKKPTGVESTSSLNLGPSSMNQTLDSTKDGGAYNLNSSPGAGNQHKPSGTTQTQSLCQLKLNGSMNTASTNGNTNTNDGSSVQGIPQSLNTSKDSSLVSNGPGMTGPSQMQKHAFMGGTQSSAGQTPNNVVAATTSRGGRMADGSRDKKSRGGNQPQPSGRSVQTKGKHTKENVSPLPPQKAPGQNGLTAGGKVCDQGNKSATLINGKRGGVPANSRPGDEDKLATSRLNNPKPAGKTQENMQTRHFSELISGVECNNRSGPRDDEEVLVPVLNFETSDSGLPIQQQLLAGSLNIANTSQLYKMPGKKGASSELERARALKKAALKTQLPGVADVVGTPTKAGGHLELPDGSDNMLAGIKPENQGAEVSAISHRKLTPLIGVNSDSKSASKAAQKRAVVENSGGLKTLTCAKPESLELPNLTPASVLVIGGYGSDPETELPMQRFVYSSQQWERLPDKVCQVKSAGVRISNNKVWLVGGKAKGQRLATITEIDVFTGKATTLDATLTKPKSGAGVAYLDGFVYVIGGNSGESILSEMEIINVETLEVKKGPSMNSRRDEMGVTVGDDGNVYAFGGYGGNNHDFLSTCERFNPKKHRWEMISSMKKARRSFCCVTAPDGIYCVAGFDGKSYINAVER